MMCGTRVNMIRMNWSLHFRFVCSWCRVIITTRSKTISSIIILNSDVMCLDILFDDHCWGIIKHSLRKNLEQHEDLKEIGVNFAKKCKGLILAAKVIEDYLGIKSKEREWDSLLNYDLLDLANDKNDVYHVFKLSYDHFFARLKRYFAYYFLICQNHIFKVENLIQI